MAYIPIESKISLINKYIQLNFLKASGKSMHEEVPENDIFTSIIEDLKAFTEKPEEQKLSLNPVISALKNFQESQSNTLEQFESLMENLKSIREEQSNQVNLDEIIKELESFEQGQKK